MSETLRVCAQRLREYLDHRVGCDATWKNGVRRKFPDQGECGCGLNDLLNQPLSSPETTPAGVLPDEMRREIEALPEPLVWQDNVSRAAVLEIVDQRTPAGVLDEAALEQALSFAHPGPRPWPGALSSPEFARVIAREYAAALGRSGSGGGRG